MQVVIRADSSLQIGGGHIYRCATLAAELRRRGHDVTFVCRDLAGAMTAYLNRLDFEYRLLPKTDSEAAAEFENHDFELTSAAVDLTDVDWVVVDHYSLGPDYESKAKSKAKRLFAIDDKGRKHASIDLLLDQNYYRDHRGRYSGKVPETCRLLTGPVFALLRPEFLESRPEQPKLWSGPRTILVSFGAADPTNESSRVFRALQRARLPGFQRALVVVGETCPHLDELHDLASKDPRLEIILQPPKIAEVMRTADLCIGASGATNWERLCLGLPSILITTADNQEETARDLDEAGAAILLGRNTDLDEESLSKRLEKLLEPGGIDFESLARKGLEWIDGLGTTRVAIEMESFL